MRIEARSENSYLVDITDLFLSDSDLFALKGAKEALKLGGYQQGQSYALDVKAFPETSTSDPSEVMVRQER